MVEVVKSEKISNGEITLLVKGLSVMKAQIVRSKTKDASDPDMVSIYDKKIATIDALTAKLYTKELF